MKQERRGVGGAKTGLANSLARGLIGKRKKRRKFGHFFGYPDPPSPFHPENSSDSDAPGSHESDAIFSSCISKN